eukprot:Protomagalhaensia_wolfi_Nauph_80__3106@NODE_3177_length_865_cov_2_274818_g2489_i0_p2_GENE_NODE_3177_length_865_cov_2_274818_g2489_i0NODE_3177_length_865_cov_2_274818_g2489_i0_p2_ORF_typecomplete_len132_score22_08DUF5040/PF16443_5/0_051_NODE_3177_length_865_cov_2_274818_g2489_i0339734
MSAGASERCWKQQGKANFLRGASSTSASNGWFGSSVKSVSRGVANDSTAAGCSGSKIPASGSTGFIGGRGLYSGGSIEIGTPGDWSTMRGRSTGMTLITGHSMTGPPITLASSSSPGTLREASSTNTMLSD